MFVPRPKQQEVLAYRRGSMGVSAVPGSGKTHTLSYLAAGLIAASLLDDEQEVLVVTLVNSAVDNFAHRVGQLVKERGLLPHLGYRVRTLHGLAHDIVRERPSLANLSSDFQILDERLAGQIRAEAAQSWLQGDLYLLDDYLSPDLEEGRREQVRRQLLPRLVDDVALSVIRYAKDRQISPQALRDRLEGLPLPLPLAEMGAAIYADYQRALLYRGAVDFDDLIRLALQALHLDEKYLARLRYRWPYILEDEAQDSSRLQEQILRLLAGPDGNWVRVGDPNQAIFETFTTANPQFLRDFMQTADYRRQLPNSGRSTPSIIALANRLIEWTQAEHPVAEVRGALTPPYIQPAPPGDPQPNPPDEQGQVLLVSQKFTPQEEIEAVVASLKRWLPENPQATVAVLAPRNQRGFEVVDALRRHRLEYVDNLRSTSATRLAASALGSVVSYLADPQSPRKLARAYAHWRRPARSETVTRSQVGRVAELLRKCRRVEDYLWPRPGQDWLAGLALPAEEAGVQAELDTFRTLVQRWQGAALLPVDQVVLTLAQDLFSEPADLALAHKLAAVLRQASEANQDWRLPELTQELDVVARNERRFLGFSEDDTGFDPQRYRGKVVVTTMHKAKGLEWDRVYLMSVNTYDFPSGLPSDQYIPERWFLRDRLNLEAETLAQLEAAFSRDEYSWYQEGAATRQARLDYVSERLRLLYVGITRAKQDLIITWNSGRQDDLQPALPFTALQAFRRRDGSPPTE